ncbi:B12-binding domain-containing radical SAM protein [Mahella australiensis]|uniref:B12-binding domain-containing radical SAM protein n=1 Tax=Mahella australiensis TaxID=252966 RepID=UPI0003092F2E|nr:cobalamin-dependent protein [Mahella australiensis]
MNVLLVNAPSNGIYYKMGLKLPPLGVAYLAAYLRKDGKHSVDIIDMNAQPIKLQDIPWRDWDIVGISGDTSRHNKVLEIAAYAKEASRIVVTGGYHVTFLDEDVLRTGNADYVVRGEGEEIFAELVDALADGGGVSKVNGISYLDADGNIVRALLNEYALHDAKRDHMVGHKGLPKLLWAAVALVGGPFGRWQSVVEHQMRGLRRLYLKMHIAKLII